MRIFELEKVFRDTRIDKLGVSYDYLNSNHSVILTLSKRCKGKKEYEFSQVTSVVFFENFSTADISHCKIIKTEEGFYTSLDPYLESDKIDDRDNMTIRSKSIEAIE